MENKLDKIVRFCDVWSEILGWAIIILAVVVIIVPALWAVFTK